MPDKLLIGNYPIIFVIWNLFLLLIPYFLYVFLIRLEKSTQLKKLYHKISAIFIGLLWLLFIPNAAYVIVDTRHIASFCNHLVYKNCIDNVWHILFFFTYGLIGWLAYVFLLKKMKEFIKKIYNARASNVFVILIIPLISLGVLLGLIERWNSWQLFSSPFRIFADAANYFVSGYYLENYFLFTLFLFLLYYLGDFVYRKLVNRQ